MSKDRSGNIGDKADWVQLFSKGGPGQIRGQEQGLGPNKRNSGGNNARKNVSGGVVPPAARRNEKPVWVDDGQRTPKKG